MYVCVYIRAKVEGLICTHLRQARARGKLVSATYLRKARAEGRGSFKMHRYMCVRLFFLRAVGQRCRCIFGDRENYEVVFGTVCYIVCY